LFYDTATDVMSFFEANIVFA